MPCSSPPSLLQQLSEANRFSVVTQTLDTSIEQFTDDFTNNQALLEGLAAR